MSALDHLEQTFAEAYRKEIDQEENVWRTLPFFAATLAVEIGGLTQLREPMLDVNGPASWLLAVLGCLVVGATLIVIVSLGVSIASADFTYIAGEPSILAYTSELEEAQRAGLLGGDEALEQLKRFLVRQYAGVTDNNRAINRHRATMRRVAGVAILVSVLATFALGGVTVAHQIIHRAPAGALHAARPGESRSDAVGAEAARATPRSGGPQGLVHNSGDDRDDRGGGAHERRAPPAGAAALTPH